MSISIISGSYPVLAASTDSTTSVAFAGDTPPVATGAETGAGAAATGAGAAATAAGAAPPSSAIIASTTSPTVCVRDRAATFCASTLSSFCTSDRISTRLIESTPSSVSRFMSISIISGSYPVLAASTDSTTSVAFAGDTPPVATGAETGAGAAATGAGAAATAAGAAPPSSAIIASTTSPTVCVRDRAATFCASTLSSFCTSDRISTRLIESTPSSVSRFMSISIISGSYPVLAASTLSTTSVAWFSTSAGQLAPPQPQPHFGLYFSVRVGRGSAAVVGSLLALHDAHADSAWASHAGVSSAPVAIGSPDGMATARPSAALRACASIACSRSRSSASAAWPDATRCSMTES